MYLSKILLDTSKRKTQLALAAPTKFHGAIEEAFLEKQKRNLWRIDMLRGKTYLLIVSQEKPNLSSLETQFGFPDCPGESKEYEELLDRITAGSTWQFRLVANPTHSKKEEGERGKATAHISESHQMEWLRKQSEKRGFSIVPDKVFIKSSRWTIFHKYKGAHRICILEVTYEGILKVEDVELFKQTLLNGIGREKAYGMGMLTIVRA